MARLCSAGGCGTVVKTGRCAKHQRPEYASLYHTNRWRRISALVIQRDGICQRCGARPAVIADHIVPLRTVVARGGDPLDPGNLRGICRQCNGELTPYGRGGGG